LGRKIKMVDKPNDMTIKKPHFESPVPRFIPVKSFLKRSFFLLGVFLLSLQAESQDFNSFITRLNALPEANRQAAADSLLPACQPIPWIEYDTMVHFIYKGAAASVGLVSDATGWDSGKPFAHISGTNIWYFTDSYPADARLEYQLVINDSVKILDPANPHIFTGGLGSNSEFRMPAYKLPPEISFHSTIPHGTLRDTTFHSSFLGNDRPVRIYLPHGYPSGNPSYPVILFNDGLEFITLCNANNILDYLIARHLMAPVIAVFVPPVHREDEFTGDEADKYTQFIVSELMPVIDKRYKTSKDPGKRAIAGISNGGNIALRTGIKHAEQFGKIAAMSSNVQRVISKNLSSRQKQDISFYIDLGTCDLPALIPMVRNLRDILEKKGYHYQYHEWHDGHSWGNWKGHLRYPLIEFFPYPGQQNNNINQKP